AVLYDQGKRYRARVGFRPSHRRSSPGLGGGHERGRSWHHRCDSSSCAGARRHARRLIVGVMARILVVDDERSMREFLEILLMKEGHEVLLAGSEATALAALERTP